MQALAECNVRNDPYTLFLPVVDESIGRFEIFIYDSHEA